MKDGIHPEYRPVVFEDIGAHERFIISSTIATTETVEHEGKEYPLYKLDISNVSHPFFTGKQKFVDSAGRVEKFQKRFGGNYFGGKGGGKGGGKDKGGK